MLIQFSVENFKSIKDKATLSMVATKDNSHKENIVNIDRDLSLLKTAEIYGANGSGKSSILEALVSISYFGSGRNDVKRLYKPHFLRNTDEVTFEWDFELSYELGFYICHYEISLSSEGIENERLSYSPSFRKESTRNIFLRKGPVIELDNSLQEFSQQLDKGKSFSILGEICLKTTSNVEISRILDLMFYFIQNIKFTSNIGILPYSSADDYSKMVSDTKEELSRKGMDFSPIQQLFDWALNQPSFYDLKNWMNLCGVPVIEIKKIENNFILIYENDISVSLNDESEGTKYLVRVFDTISKMGKDSNLIFCVDEIETHLHPLIVRKIVEYIHGLSNKNGLESQLIFTTHNAELLDLSLVRKDQIWFTQMHEGRSTELYSLAEFKDVFENTDIHTWYLEGCYGGVPNIDEFENTKEEYDE